MNLLQFQPSLGWDGVPCPYGVQKEQYATLKIPTRISCKAAFARQANVRQLLLTNSNCYVCVNDTTTCWETVGDK